MNFYKMDNICSLSSSYSNSVDFNFRAIMAEYSGAVLGVLSAVLYGRKGHVWKKVAVLHFYEPLALFRNTKFYMS